MELVVVLLADGAPRGVNGGLPCALAVWYGYSTASLRDVSVIITECYVPGQPIVTARLETLVLV